MSVVDGACHIAFRAQYTVLITVILRLGTA